MNDNVHEGGCVCGEVRFRTTADPDHVVVCHCEWCQRRTGTGFAVIAKFRHEDYELLSGDLTTYREVNEVGRWLDLAFCPRCGTNIGFTQERRLWAQAIDSGTFDDPSWIRAAAHKFIHGFTRNHRDWSQLPEGADAHEGAFPEKI
tara:strand:+ start:1965 stop:2402 length:438 start_codon:yes stop_codon:yes gene_type:complete